MTSNDTKSDTTGGIGVGVSPRRVQARPGLPSGRAIFGALLVTVAALGAYALSNQDPVDRRIEYVVAAVSIDAGQVLNGSDLRVVRLELTPEVAARSVSAIEIAIGTVALSPLEPGDLLTRTNLAAAELDQAGNPLPEVSFPVAPERTPRGLQAGETVTVFATSRSGNAATTHVSAIDAIVVHIDTADGSIGSSRSAVITLALPPSANLIDFVHDTQVADLEIVRSNGDQGADWLASTATGAADNG